MPSYSTLVLAFAVVATVHAIPVDEISARNGIGSAMSGVGGQAEGGSVSDAPNSCTGPSISCFPSDLSLLKLNSENAGDGGDAASGASSGHALLSHIGGTKSRKVPIGSGFSGAGGEASGGSVVKNHPSLVELNSENAGNGGNASSGSSSGLVD